MRSRSDVEFSTYLLRRQKLLLENIVLYLRTVRATIISHYTDLQTSAAARGCQPLNYASAV